MKKIMLLIFILNCLLTGYSQTTNPNTNLPNVFPVNPKAFEYMKYSEVPVSKYTGVPNISVPIYTIKANGLDIPINLSYHSSGFRVNEEAGWTGLGWTLNAAGSIVQVVNGFDDFGWYRNRNNELQGMVNAPNSPISQSTLNTCTNVNFTVQAEGDCLPLLQNSNILNFSESESMLNGTKDMSADIFKFNAMGYSGEFVLDWQSETFKCLSDKNLKIECPNYNNPTGVGDVHPNSFKIITPDGNQFFFDLKEETIIGRTVTSPPSNTLLELAHLEGEKSSRVFQLTSIVTIGGDVITFNYIQSSVVENLPAISMSNETYSFEPGPTVSTGPAPITPIYNIFKQKLNYTVNYSKQSFSYLASINFANGNLLFNSTADRLDCIGTRKLNNVVLKDNNNVVIVPS